MKSFGHMLFEGEKGLNSWLKKKFIWLKSYNRCISVSGIWLTTLSGLTSVYGRGCSLSNLTTSRLHYRNGAASHHMNGIGAVSFSVIMNKCSKHSHIDLPLWGDLHLTPVPPRTRITGSQQPCVWLYVHLYSQNFRGLNRRMTSLLIASLASSPVRYPIAKE